MKKRRELDALVNGFGKSSRGRSAKKSQELLLENMSDSSEIDEFSVPTSTGKTVVRKRGFMHFCKSCLTVCSFFMLLSCVISIMVLVLVYNDLKSELEKDQKKTLLLTKTIEDLETLTFNVDNINKTMLDLSTKMVNMKGDIDKSNGDSPEFKELSNSIHGLKESLAKMGSNLDGVKSDVKTLKDAQVSSPSMTDNSNSQKVNTKGDADKNSVDSSQFTELSNSVHQLQQNMAAMRSNLNSVKSDIQSLKDAQESYPSIPDTTKSQKQEMERLENVTLSLENRLQLLELRPATGSGTTIPTPDMHDIVQQAVATVTEELKNYTFSSVESRLQEVNARISALEMKSFQQFTTSTVSAGGEGLVSLQEFIGTTSNKFLMMNNSIQAVKQRLSTSENLLKAQQIKSLNMENITSFLEQETQTLKNVVHSIEEGFKKSQTLVTSPHRSNSATTTASTTTEKNPQNKKDNGGEDKQTTKTNIINDKNTILSNSKQTTKQTGKPSSTIGSSKSSTPQGDTATKLTTSSSSSASVNNKGRSTSPGNIPSSRTTISQEKVMEAQSTTTSALKQDNDKNSKKNSVSKNETVSDGDMLSNLHEGKLEP